MGRIQVGGRLAWGICNKEGPRKLREEPKRRGEPEIRSLVADRCLEPQLKLRIN